MSLRCRWICPVLLAVLLAPAHAEENDRSKMRVLHTLANRQERAAEGLQSLLSRIEVLTRDLRDRGDKEKADLLEQAAAIVTEKRIGVSTVRGSGGKAHAILGDLEAAMNEMARILKERPEATAEVQDLGQKVVATLDNIVHVLTGQDELKSLEQREKALNDARADVNELAQQQRRLKEQTRNTVPRTRAEQATAVALKDLERLARDLRSLDRRARQDLREIDAAREYASRLQDLVRRQQRLKQETAVRAGRTDKLTPRVNRAVAELEAVARAARAAEEEEAVKGTLAEIARKVGELARRQEKIAAEIERRAKLERARGRLEGADAAELKKTLEEVARSAPAAEAAALRQAAANLEANPRARDQVAAAIQATLERMASPETLARDERALARDVERARGGAPGKAEASLKEAERKARQAAERLEAGRHGDQPAREAADALREAAQQLKREADQARAAVAGEQQAKRREIAAARAERAAKELARLAEDRDTRNAGMSGDVQQAREAARRAAEELRRATTAGRRGETSRARDEAGAAAERLEKAMRDLREGLAEGEDLVERQGHVAEDLKNLADRRKQAEERAKLRAASDHAQQAQGALRRSALEEAAAEQDEVLARLEELVRQAEAQAQAAARAQAAALKRAQDQTRAATEKASRIAKNLEQGGRTARENDARRRMEEAQQKTEEAAEALRRSLRRLGQAMPKSAEQERREAMDKVEQARRNLSGVREAHRDLGDQVRRDLQRLARRQEELEAEVKRLEQRLKRLKEQAGHERLQDAQAHMREARQRLDAGDADEAERAQERAEKALREAEKELDREERRYRALRQYELLFKLKEELKNFRRSAQSHRETLQLVDANVRQAGRVTRYIRKQELDPLRARIKTLQGDVADKAAAVEKEGAVVYTYILRGCARDLREVEAQLALKEVGLVPQELLGDVVRRFDLAIKGLERDLRERQQSPQQQGQGQQPGGQRPALVPQDAEIRMVMVLQKALNEERESFFANRPDFGQRAASAGERARIERLYHQQGSLAELFDSLRQTMLGREEEDFDFPDESGEEEERR
ncbi:MAG: hypothetical protein ACYTEZ_00790 [Planctomycetota bacterium]|jgi:hypothetical protein